MKVRRKYIGKIVEEILTVNNISDAPINLPRITKKLGLEVIKQDADDKLSGMLINTGNGEAIVGVNARHHPNRQRFTIAHEIGHFLLHKFDGVHFDAETPGSIQLNFRDDNSSTGLDVFEKEANLFAAELLMPKKFIERDLIRDQNINLADVENKTIKVLASKYKVSVQAFTYRVAYLNFVQK